MEEIFVKQKTTLEIHLPKELDHHTSEKIRVEADRIVQRQNIRHIIFDFSETTFMDSSGIGVIMGRYRTLRMIGGDVCAVHVNEHIQKVLRLSGVHKLIPIYDEKMGGRL